jgi:hypothetical protein
MRTPHPPGCPHPTSASPAQIEFVPQRAMVDWLHPAQLARTGLKAAIASTFGSYADKRELQAALAHVEGADDRYELTDGELWFDYTADLGDGFDATYSIARLLATDLTLDGEVTRRGRFVILGGDQVYPTAARDEYQNRFIGPYRAADPFEPHRVDGQYAPAMYALPGNHDWYDGLTSFLRIFCQRKGNRTGRWIGGWRTRQRRSYFAIELPGNWWIWAVDSQLESDMDHPQLMYFESLAEQMLTKESDPSKHKIILVTAEPSWVNCRGDEAAGTCRNHPEAFNTLAHFEKTYVRTKGFELRLVLSGDFHHYVRYASTEKDTHTMRITAGGGGAFLLGTEQMPSVISVREDGGNHPYVKKAAFPDTTESRRYEAGIWRIPFQRPAFGTMLGGIYLLLAWLLQTGSRATDLLPAGSLLDHIYLHGANVSELAIAFMLSPLSTTLGLVIVASLWGFTFTQAKGHPWPAKISGAVHGLAHVVLCCALFATITTALKTTALPRGGVWFSLALMTLLFVLAWVLGSWLFAGYLWLSCRWTGVHAGDLFSSMAITDCKHFLRMRLDASGRLTLFVIGLKKIPHDWVFEAPGDRCGRPWFQSKKFMVEEEYSPFVVEKIEL